jgi:hypothetical protein
MKKNTTICIVISKKISTGHFFVAFYLEQQQDWEKLAIN